MQISPAAAAPAAPESMVYPFAGGNDGAIPYSGMIDVGGILYGTTSSGGTGTKNCSTGCGTVFSLDPASGTETVLNSFQGSGNGSTDGADPQAGLLYVQGTLYGTTAQGGMGTTNCSTGCGTVFSLDPATGTETPVYSFQGSGNGSADGANPEASLINVGGTLYGTTYNGGTGTNCNNGCGTVFSFNLSTGIENVLYSFQGSSDGAHPQSKLGQIGIELYGTTTQGGTGTTNCSAGCGTMFSVSKKGIETVLYSFQGGSDGAFPASGLIRTQGLFYGTTEFGGTGQCSGGSLPDCGTVYSITPTGSESVIYSFQGNNDGAYPVAPLLVLRGALWGTASSGGDSLCGAAGGCGVVFSMTLGGAETIQWPFQGGINDGATPLAPLTRVKHSLYGTTSAGGSHGCAGAGCGTVFEITPR